jgi:AcrR family transcriptional regulator
VSTRDRILEAAAGRFGIRGVDAVSLDEIAAEVGVRKQTVLYWFPSKEELVDGVLEVTAADLALVIDAAGRASPDEPLARIDAVVTAVFRLAVRRPALLGLVRELSRLPPVQATRLRAHVDPLVQRAVDYLGREMAAGRLRRGDPRLVAALAYGTVTGIATEPKRCAPSAGRPTPPACAACAPSCAPSCTPPWRRDGQCFVLRRRRP